MAEIQLKSNWAGFVPGSIVSVSEARAVLLVKKLKIARYTPAYKSLAKKKKGKKG